MAMMAAASQCSESWPQISEPGRRVVGQDAGEGGGAKEQGEGDRWMEARGERKRRLAGDRQGRHRGVSAAAPVETCCRGRGRGRARSERGR